MGNRSNLNSLGPYGVIEFRVLITLTLAITQFGRGTAQGVERLYLKEFFILKSCKRSVPESRRVTIYRVSLQT